MAITQVGSAQTIAGNNGNDCNINFLTAPIEGDIVICIGGNSRSNIGVIDPPGYTRIHYYGINNPGFGAWYKIMGSTPDTSISMPGTGQTADSNAYATFVFRNVSLTSPIDNGGTVVFTHDIPSITTATDGAVVMIGSAKSSILSPGNSPTGYSTVTARNGNDTNDIHIAAAWKTLATAGVENPTNFSSWTSGSTVSFIFALRDKDATAPVEPEVLVVEDFEDTSYSITPGGNWSRSTDTRQSGTYSLKSLAVTSGQSNATFTVPANAIKVRFHYYVSSESGFDFFRFLNNGVQQLETSGEVPWTLSPYYDVTPGQTLTFRYVKDEGVSTGFDAAYIDNLTFYQAGGGGGGGPAPFEGWGVPI